MQAETARQCLTDIGCRPERASRLMALVEEDKLTEAIQQLRCLRCELMEEMHGCQRRLDQLDWLIRETERANPEPSKGRRPS